MIKLNFEYLDEFDREHYPILGEHRSTMKLIVFDILQLPEKETKKPIGYTATIHGRIFQIETFPRIHAAEMKQLTELENVRWIGFDKNCLQIALTH